MLKKNIVLFIFIIIVCFASCKNKQIVDGNWGITKLKIWNNYKNQHLFINNTISNVSFSESNSVEVAKFTNGYKDSLLQISKNCYLHLNLNGTFKLNDHGFLSQTLSDTDWQGNIVGIWNVDKEKFTLNLIQSNSKKKSYKIIELTEKQLVIGELYQDEPTPITE